MFVALKKEIVVAAAFEAQFIDYLLLAFALDLGFLLGVCYQVKYVADKLALVGCDTTRRKDHCSLSVFPVLRVGIGVFKRVQLVFLHML